MPVKVAVRSRPLNENEQASCVEIKKEENSVIVAQEKLYKFDHVFDEFTTNTDLYEECISGVVDDFTLGSNATVLAYGQTGSGKTFTMGTNYSAKDSNLMESKVGIIPRVLKDLFEKIDKDSVVEISFLEIYNETIQDILMSNHQIVQLQERNNVVKLNNLSSIKVSNVEEALELLEIGSIARTTGATAQNLHSSRSHAIFIVNLTKIIGEKKSAFKLYLVDLAGSEGIRKSKTDGQRKREGISINLGLLSLGKVISSLCVKNPGHIPYRDSILTRMLKDSINGTSSTLMISCINPDISSMTETVDTLRFSSSAINIPSITLNRPSFSMENNPLRSKLDQLPPTPANLRSLGSLPLLTSSTPGAINPNTGHQGIFSPEGISGFSAIKPIQKPPIFAVPKIPPKLPFHEKERYNNDFSGLISPIARKVHGMLEKSLMKGLATIEKRNKTQARIIKNKTEKRKSLEVITNTSTESLSAKRRRKARKASQILNTTFSPIKASPEKTPNTNSSTTKMNVTFSPVNSSSFKEQEMQQSVADDEDTFELTLPSKKRKLTEELNLKHNSAQLKERGRIEQIDDIYSPLVKKVTSRMEMTIYPEIEKRMKKMMMRENEKRKSPRLLNNSREEKINKLLHNERNCLNLKLQERRILDIINYGSTKELKSLPCIGEKTAQIIITYRNTKGTLKNLQDLKHVATQKSFLSRFLKANCLEMLIEK